METTVERANSKLMIPAIAEEFARSKRESRPALRFRRSPRKDAPVDSHLEMAEGEEVCLRVPKKSQC